MAAANQSLRTENLYLVSVCLNLLLLLVCSRLVVSQSTVQYLPGFSGRLPFELETGYVSIDDSDDVQLFYYFIKSERKPKEDPLLLWTTGGPGCSALCGLAFEIGPIYFKIAEYNGSLPTLVLNPNSWTKVANIIFLDAPVGSGFSYSRTVQGSYSGDTKSARQTYTFLRKWLVNHPEFISNPLYVGGDSYSGIPVPIIVRDILDGIGAGHKPLINFKGYLLGNPVTYRNLENNLRIPYFHGMGILSDELYESVKKNCAEEYVNVDPSNAQCILDLQAVSECTSGLDASHILEPKCVKAAPKPKQMITDRRSLYDNSSKLLISPPPFPALECRSYGYMLSYYWTNDDSVRKALNIRKGTVQEWVRCNYGGLNYTKNVESSIGYHQSLSKRNCRSLVYTGDHDPSVPHISTQAWIRSLNYSIIDDWRPWSVDGQVAGYTKTYSNNMTFATVKGGGHIAPRYQPKECLAMFTRWIARDPL